MSIQALSTGKVTVSGTYPDNNISDIRLTTNLSTIIGFNAAKNNVGLYNTIFGYGAAQQARYGNCNLFIGTQAGNVTNTDNNFFVGNFAGIYNNDGYDNTFVGNHAGRYTTQGTYNTFIGTHAGSYGEGTENVHIGYCNSHEAGDGRFNVSIGANVDMVNGLRLVQLGAETIVHNAVNSIVMGTLNEVSGANNFVVGQKVVNTGSNCLLLIGEHTGEYRNSNNNAINIYDKIQGNYNDVDQYVTSMTGDRITLQTSTPSSYIDITPTGIKLGTSATFTSNGFGFSGQLNIKDLDVVGNTVLRSGVTVDSNLVIRSANGAEWWTQHVETSNPRSIDLVFRSRRGTVVTFNDEFTPEVLNFTGKHRCVFVSSQGNEEEGDGSSNDEDVREEDGNEGGEAYEDEHANEDGDALDDAASRVGEVVVSVGRYCDLTGRSAIIVDEAIPVVALSRRAYDPRVVGVIGGVDMSGDFRLGNMVFKNPGDRLPRVMVQTDGEGAIWVCDIAGDIKNGDYVTTSSIPGLAMRQGSEYRMNYTVAKITCDCDFQLSETIGSSSEIHIDGRGSEKPRLDHCPPPYNRCVEFAFDGIVMRKAFLGCLYV